jgi:hypothetical protein
LNLLIDVVLKAKYLFILIVLFHSSLSAQYTSDINYDDGISYDSFSEKIKNQSINSLESSLNLVPKEFWQNYVLVYRSRSLQESSFEFPRTILFGRSARFILAFNGHKHQRGFNNLEMVQFREESKSWEFREITFLPGQSPQFSEANPKKCLECHQSPKRLDVDPRPNWEPYNFWPGVFASVDDKIKPVLKIEYDKYILQKYNKPSFLLKFLPQDLFLIDEQAQEEEQLEKFNSTKLKHPRYQFLPDFNSRNPLNLTKSVVTLNMRRVARLVKSELGPLYDSYKYAIYGLGDVASLTSSKFIKHRCGQIYMPDRVYAKHINQTLQIKNLKEKDYIYQGLGWKIGMAAGLEIIFEPLGISTDDWSMDFKTHGRFSADDRFTSPHYSLEHFLMALYNNYPDDEVKDLDCKQLQIASERALQNLDETGAISEKINEASNRKLIEVKPLIQRCMNCHVDVEVGGKIAPYIPFDNFENLKVMLNENKYKRGTLLEEIIYRTSDHVPNKDQMPPAGFVDDKKRDDFINQLKELLN